MDILNTAFKIINEEDLKGSQSSGHQQYEHWPKGLFGVYIITVNFYDVQHAKQSQKK